MDSTTIELEKVELNVAQTSKPFRERWSDFADSGLRLFLSEEKAKKVWRFLYRYNLWRWGGILTGGLILTVSMQLSASALILEDSEQAIEDVFGDYLTGVTDFIAVLFGSGRLLLLVFGIALIVGGVWDGLRNQGSNWHVWSGIGAALILCVVLAGMWEDAIFG